MSKQSVVQELKKRKKELQEEQKEMVMIDALLVFLNGASPPSQGISRSTRRKKKRSFHTGRRYHPTAYRRVLLEIANRIPGPFTPEDMLRRMKADKVLIRATQKDPTGIKGIFRVLAELVQRGKLSRVHRGKYQSMLVK